MYYGIVCGIDVWYSYSIAQYTCLLRRLVVYLLFLMIGFVKKCMVVIMYLLKNHVVLGGSDAKIRSNEYDSNLSFC